MDDRLPCAFSETAVVNAVFHMGIKFQDLLFFIFSETDERNTEWKIAFSYRIQWNRSQLGCDIMTLALYCALTSIWIRNTRGAKVHHVSVQLPLLCEDVLMLWYLGAQDKIISASQEQKWFLPSYEEETDCQNVFKWKYFGLQHLKITYIVWTYIALNESSEFSHY